MIYNNYLCNRCNSIYSRVVVDDNGVMISKTIAFGNFCDQCTSDIMEFASSPPQNKITKRIVSFFKPEQRPFYMPQGVGVEVRHWWTSRWRRSFVIPNQTKMQQAEQFREDAEARIKKGK